MLNMKIYTKKQAFTLAEIMIVLTIIGIILIGIISSLRSNNVEEELYIKSGVNTLNQIDFATRRLLAKSSRAYSMLALKDASGNEFSITADGADTKLNTLYKKYLVGMRKTSLSNTYKTTVLDDKAKTLSSKGIKVSTFPYGFTLKNGAYFALKLNKNCTTSETYIVHPVYTDKRTETNSCGLIFYDVNGEKKPNVLGIDQYIVSIGKIGLK